MVEYSVDTNPRLRVYFGVAAFSIAAASALSEMPQLAGYKFAAPSAFAIFGILLWLFDKHLWRVPVIRQLSGIPYLGGNWKGTLKRIGSEINPNTDSGTEEMQVVCRVTQTWKTIDFVFKGRSSISDTRVVGFFVDNPDNILIRYIYAVRPGTMVEKEIRLGEGVVEFRLNRRSDGDILEGVYYSEKLNRGDIFLRRDESS